MKNAIFLVSKSQLYIKFTIEKPQTPQPQYEYVFRPYTF